MTLTLVATTASRTESFGVPIRSASRTIEEIWTATEVGHIDSLNRRLGALRSLRPGWDGETGIPPSREAVNCLFLASERLSRGRAVIGASPHPDGYINVEWERNNVWYTARLWQDHIELIMDNETNDEFEHHTIGLDSAALAAFLQGSE